MGQKIISLGELAQHPKILCNKSRLSYYAKLGLIKPIGLAGKTQVYDRDETIKTIKEIDRLIKNKIKLSQIKSIL